MFPILEVHSLPKQHDFCGMCFSFGFMFHFPWFQVWTVTISRNSFVLYLTFFFQVLRSSYLKILRSFSVIFLTSDPCLHMGNSKTFGWNRIIYVFSWYLLLWFLRFCWGSETFSELHVCFALLELLPFWEPLQAFTVFTKQAFFWRLVSWRFLACVNSEIFQLQRHFYWISFFIIGFNGVVWKVFVNPCLFPWVCHARLFCFFSNSKVFLCDIHVQIP